MRGMKWVLLSTWSSARMKSVQSFPLAARHPSRLANPPPPRGRRGSPVGVREADLEGRLVVDQHVSIPYPTRTALLAGSTSANYGHSHGHDYERDTSDSSKVDVDAVNDLLGERLRARKRGDFDAADAIREQLRDDHMVTVFDQDKIWATGELAGGTNRGGRFGRGGAGNNRGGGRGGRGGTRRDRRPPARDFRSSFGPNGHDYDACTEAGPASSQLSEPAIHSRVAERLMAKMNRDFETADRIQLELAEEGVFINDRTKEWRADGVQFIDPSEGRRKPKPRDMHRPYVQSRHSLPLHENVNYTLERIGELVMERSQHKQAKNFLKADSIREALEKACNVVIDDRVREWSIGGSFGKDADIKRAHSAALKYRNYVRSSASLDLPGSVTEEEVQARVDARTRARTNRQYQESDVMREEILNTFNVVIHDTIKMWSVGGDFGSDDPVKARTKALSTYTRRGGGNLSEDDVVLIQDMLVERFEAKRARNFEAADEIRSHLYTTYNINLDDKSREWRVLSDDYVQTKAERGAQELTAEEVSMVESIIAKRAILKKNKSYDEADAIRDELQYTYSVLVDDKAKEWKVVSSGGNSKFAAEAARSQQKQIEKEVNEEFDSIFNRGKDELDSTDSSSIVAADTVVVTPEEGHISAPSPSAPVPALASALSREELISLTIPLLKEKLREAGKPVSGKKADLIDRLLA